MLEDEQHSLYMESLLYEPSEPPYLKTAAWAGLGSGAFHLEYSFSVIPCIFRTSHAQCKMCNKPSYCNDIFTPFNHTLFLYIPSLNTQNPDILRLLHACPSCVFIGWERWYHVMKLFTHFPVFPRSCA